MWAVKDSTSKQTQRQTGGWEGSQVGVGSAPSGDHIITHFNLIFFSLYNWMLNYFHFYCKRYRIPKSAQLYRTLYMFCIGLMMAVLQPKHVALM